MKIEDLPFGSTFHVTGNLRLNFNREHELNELRQTNMEDRIIPMLLDHIAHPELAQHIFGYCSFGGNLYLGIGTNQSSIVIIQIKDN